MADDLSRLSHEVGSETEQNVTTVAIPHDEPPVEPELELDAPTGLAAMAGAGRQLEDRRPGPDGSPRRAGAAVVASGLPWTIDP